MSKNKLVASVFIIGFLVPQITFASWWNPFTWFTKKVVSVHQVPATSTTETAVKSATTSDQNKETLNASQAVATVGKSIVTATADTLIKTRNIQRTTDVAVIMVAVMTYLEINDLKLPDSITSKPKEICIDRNYSCEGMVELWLAPKYMKSMPIEPGSTKKNGSGYMISRSEDSLITISAQYAEGGATITREYDYLVPESEAKTPAERAAYKKEMTINVNNSYRISHVGSLIDWVTRYANDHKGVFPSAISANPLETCTKTGSPCSKYLDLISLGFVSTDDAMQMYVFNRIKDPLVTTGIGSGYVISKAADGNIIVMANQAEGGKKIGCQTMKSKYEANVFVTTCYHFER